MTAPDANDLPPIEFTDMPVAIELPHAFGWAQWHYCVAQMKRLLGCCCEALTGPAADPIVQAWSDTVQLYPEDLVQRRLQFIAKGQC